MKSKGELINQKRLLAFCIFCLCLSFPQEIQNSGVEKETVQKTPRKFKYLRYKAKETKKEEKQSFWPMPEFEMIDVDEYVQRAENLCGDYTASMAEIQTLSGNPEMAIRICLEGRDYPCAYEVAKKYQDVLPHVSEYDPFNIVRKAEEEGIAPTYWLASAYEELKVLDRAEEFYKEDYEEYGAYDLVDFYLRQNFFTEVRNLDDTKNGTYVLEYVAGAGKLKETGLYGRYLAKCRADPWPNCFSHLDAKDISMDMLQQAWEYAASYDYDFALVAKAGVDSGLTRRYLNLFRNKLIKKISDGGEESFLFLDFSAVTIAGLQDEIFPYLEKTPEVYNRFAYTAEEQGDLEKAYELYKQGDIRGVYGGMITALENDNTEKAKEFARILLEGNDNVVSVKGSGAGEEGTAYIALGEWKEAMANCEWGMGTDNFDAEGSCQCAVMVVEGLQKEIKGEE